MGIVILTLITLLILLILVSYINHRIQLAEEESLFQPIGELVEVNGHKMNVYEEGEGQQTLIFMSGGGTCSPVLDFKSLYAQLTEGY